MPGLLDGRVVAITGAGSGLGRAYALAVSTAGASVVVNDVDAESANTTAALIAATGGAVVVLVGSVADPTTGEAIVASAVEAFGHIDGLVNNAGVLSPGHPTTQGLGSVERTVGINVLGAMYCGMPALRAMVAQGRGAVVNVVSGAIEGIPGLSLYGSTKGAVMGLTYGWAVDIAGSGVRVNAISPLARTGMSGLSEMDGELKGGSPDTVAPAVVYLLSDRAEKLNGQVLRFDGRRLGVVSEPRLIALTPSQDWTADGIALALDGTLGDRLRPLGMAATPKPERVVI
jgi:NAD(P)-dependent dehydrogenase (short-subunit alcohol dehydrogenase family)